MPLCTQGPWQSHAALSGASVVKGSQQGLILFLRQSLCSIRKPVSSPRPTNPGRCRAQALSRLAVAPTLPRTAIIARPYLDSSEHAGTMMMVGITFEGSPRVAHECSCGVLVFGGCYDPNHDAAMRICSETPRRRTHSKGRHKSHGGMRDTATSNRHRRPVQV